MPRLRASDGARARLWRAVLKLVAQRLEAVFASRPWLRFALDLAFYVAFSALLCRLLLSLGDVA